MPKVPLPGELYLFKEKKTCMRKTISNPIEKTNFLNLLKLLQPLAESDLMKYLIKLCLAPCISSDICFSHCG